jgi:hypothetical protein
LFGMVLERQRQSGSEEVNELFNVGRRRSAYSHGVSMQQSHTRPNRTGTVARTLTEPQ